MPRTSSSKSKKTSPKKLKKASSSRKSPARRKAAPSRKAAVSHKAAAPAKKAATSGKASALPAVLDISTVTAFCELLRDIPVGKNAAVCLDGAAVQKITTPCFQLLLAKAAELQKYNATLQITHPSETFVNNMKTLGMQEQLQQWVDNGSANGTDRG